MAACFNVKAPLSASFLMTGAAAPIAQQVYSNDTAEWLSITPGVYLSGGSAVNYELRIYKGNFFPPPAGAGNPNVNSPYPKALPTPVAVIQSSSPQVIIPWNAALQLVVEIRPYTNTTTSGDTVAVVMQPWDNGN